MDAVHEKIRKIDNFTWRYHAIVIGTSCASMMRRQWIIFLFGTWWLENWGFGVGLIRDKQGIFWDVARVLRMWWEG